MGAGGLVRAYGTAVSQCLDIAKWEMIIPCQRWKIQCNFSDEAAIRRYLEKNKYQLINASYAEYVTLEIEAPIPMEIELKDDLKELSLGKANIEKVFSTDHS